jgi:hypothetical protein
VNKLLPVDIAREELAQSIKIVIDKRKNNIERLFDLKRILENHKGKVPVFVHLNNNGSKGKLFSLNQYQVSLKEDLILEIKKLLGEESIILNSK